MVSLNSVEKLIPILVQAAGQAGAYEAGKPLTITLPAETITLDLTREGLGRVSVSESGTTLVLQKAP